MLLYFILSLIFPLYLTFNSTEVLKKVESHNSHKNFFIECTKYPNLEINALVKSSENTLLIFFNKSYVAITEIQKENMPLVKRILLTDALIPRLNGRIESAFNYENKTYFLNNETQIWSYDPSNRLIAGPFERSKKFGCLHKNYTITSIQTFKKSAISAHMLIYYTEYGSEYLTFCDITNSKVIETYERSYRTDASEILWKNDNILEGISITGLFFTYFHITSYLGNLRYVPFIQPFSSNQLLMECPQQLCIDARIDAIVSIPSGTTYVFRGKYFWEFPSNDLTKMQFIYESVKYITDYWPELPSNIDSALYHSNLIYFFKNEYLWKYDINGREPVVESLIKDEFPEVDSKIDAIWLNKNDNQIYFIKSNRYYILEIESRHFSEIGEIIPVLHNDNEIPNLVQIDGIHEDDNGNIYLFSNNYFYFTNRGELTKRIEMRAHLSQEHLFSCLLNYSYSDIELYHDFHGFKESLVRYKPLDITFKPISNDTTTEEDLHRHLQNNTSDVFIDNNGLEIEDNRDMIKRWNQSVFSFMASNKKTHSWLLIFIIATFSFLFIVNIIALYLLFRQSRIYRVSSDT